jgi:uncharacterized protein DUF3105
MPPKPRVQTPKKRRTVAQPAHARRDRRILYGIAGSGLLALAVVVLLLLLSAGGGGPSPEEVRAALERAGCTLTSVPAQPNEPDHSDVPTPNTKVKWNTSPPTSGPHFGIPAIWGAYTEPLELTRVVHNLEHGGVYIMYGSKVPAATVEQLRSFYEDHRNGTLLAPLPSLGATIALGAWVGEGADRGNGYLGKCTRFDQEAFSAFFDGFQFKGPERFRPNDLLPGT